MNTCSSSDVDRITYAICRHVPEIQARGCTLTTAYGDLEIEHYEAEAIYRAVQKILAKRLRLALRAARDEALAGVENVVGGGV